MTDDRALRGAALRDLARCARASLAEATTPTLLIQGVGRLSTRDSSVVLCDHDGRPTFLCEQGSPVAAAARAARPALLIIPAHGPSGETFTVSFAGHLTVVRVERVNGVPVDVVALPLAAVLVTSDDPRGADVSWREVPLDLYSQAEPDPQGNSDPLATFAERVMTHTNEAHQRELRHFVARRLNIPVGTVAGASLANLDARGADVCWIDAVGAHVMTMVFADRARSAQELADRLGDQLRGTTIQELR